MCVYTVMTNYFILFILWARPTWCKHIRLFLLSVHYVPVCMHQHQSSWHNDFHTLHHWVWFLILLMQCLHDKRLVMPGGPVTPSTPWQLWTVHHKHTTLGPLKCLATWDNDDDYDEPSINFHFLIHNTGKEYYLQIKLKLWFWFWQKLKFWCP